MESEEWRVESGELSVSQRKRRNYALSITNYAFAHRLTTSYLLPPTSYLESNA